MTYRPNDGFYGQDEIFYYVEDEYGLTSSRAKIIINVTNNRPNGVDYILSTNMNQSIKVELKGEDRDKIDVVKLAYILEKVHLTELLKEIEILGTSILYPNNDFTGPDQIAYRIYDGAQYSDVHVITINVKGENITSSKTQTPKQTRTPKPIQPKKSDDKKDDGGSNMTLILVLLLVVVLAAAGGGGGGGGSDPTGGVDIGITIP